MTTRACSRSSRRVLASARRRALRVGAIVILVGQASACAALRPPPPLEVFDTSAVNGERAEAVRVNNEQPGNDEDPTVLRARDGRFYVAWSSKRRRQVDLVVRSSSDGLSWGDERRITNDADEDYYPAMMQSADGVFHVAWFRLQRRSGRTDIWYSRSADGSTWAAPVPISTAGQDWAPTMYQDAGGVLWIVWSSNGTQNRELVAAQSTDGGGRWSAPTQLTHTADEDEFPHVAIASNGERVLAWTRYRPGSRRPAYYRDASAEIVTATSRDGLTWTEPTVCSPPDPRDRQVEFAPFVFPGAQAGQVFVSWTSSRSGRRGDILVRDIGSLDTPVRQLTTYKGSDYSGKIVATAQPGEYVMVWTSTRKGKTDIFSRRFRL
jgi:hypothetical protein